MKPSSVKIIDAATGTVTGEKHEPRDAKRTFQATGQTSAGVGAVAVDIEASNDGTNFLLIATISLTLGTVTTTDGFASDAPWKVIRARVTSISGTDAAVTVWMGA